MTRPSRPSGLLAPHPSPLDGQGHAARGLRVLKWFAVLVLAVWLLHLFVSWLRGVLPWA